MARPVGTKNIESPERLWELFESYVMHERDHPMHKVEYVGKDGIEKHTPLETPITFMGFECWLANQEIITDLSHYSANTDGAYNDYRTIITRIQNNCYVHNFKGAAVGLFNANLIARKLGIKDNSEQVVEVKTFDVSLKL
jgi:hypothetical protein